MNCYENHEVNFKISEDPADSFATTVLGILGGAMTINGE